jgi:hypothetical protein
VSAIDKLFANSNAFDHSPDNDRLFHQAMGEAVALHRANSSLFDGLCRIDGWEWSDQADLRRMPHVIVTAFKERTLLSVPEEEIAHRFTSSGTGGTQSKIYLDQLSFERQRFTRNSVVESYGLVSDREVNYLCFSYDPESGGARGAAHTHTAYSGFAPARERFYAIAMGEDGQPRFRLNECIDALERFQDSGLPLRVTGFPAFGYATLKQIRQSLSFPPESLMFSGGGWKLHTGQAVPFSEYVALVDRVLGIPASHIRDVYGMVEHGIPYLTCEQGNFHIPIYGRVWAMDPATLRPLPYGEVGLFKLITPYIRSQPSISVLSTDYGAVEKDCPCGRPGGVLKLHGRAGVKKYDGCAISAAQLLGQ